MLSSGSLPLGFDALEIPVVEGENGSTMLSRVCELCIIADSLLAAMRFLAALSIVTQTPKLDSDSYVDHLICVEPDP